MFYRFVSVLALLLACNVAFSQQTQSNNLELKLEQFPAQPADGANSELQLDLNQFEQQQTNQFEQQQTNQFEQQQTNESLELNLEQFEQNKQTTQSVEEPENTALEVNLEQFGKDENLPQNEQEKPGLGKINNTGSAATKIDDTHTAGESDDVYLLKAGLWLLAVAIPVFLFMRARIRRRRRARAHLPRPRRPTYDESDHR